MTGDIRRTKRFYERERYGTGIGGDRVEGRSPQLYTSPGPGSTVTRVSQIVHGYRLTNAAVAASLLTGQRQPINPHQEQMFCMKRNRFGKFGEVMLEGFKVDPHQCAYFNGCREYMEQVASRAVA